MSVRLMSRKIKNQRMAAGASLFCAFALSGCAWVLGVADYEPGDPTSTEAPDAAVGEDSEASTPPPALVVCGNITCRPHEICGPEATRCECAAGYKVDPATTACLWSGGPKDPDFTNSPAGTWTIGGSAKLDPTATGSDGGVGIGTLRGASDLSQRFEMPSLASAEPLALVLRVRSVPDCGECTVGVHPQVSFGSGSVEFVMPSLGFDRVQLCLGERAFGAGASLALFGDLDPRASAAFYDRAEYLPAPSCPLPGVIPNGNFEGPSGWTATGGGAILDNVGTTSSRGARLTNSCALNAVTGSASFPNKSGAALRFTHKKTFDAPDYLMRLIVLGARVPPRADFGEDVVCAPAHARGNVVPIALSIGGPINGGCGAGFQLAVDDVAVTQDPKCDVPGYLFDGGFEGPISYWLPGDATGALGPNAWITETVDQFRTGSRALMLAARSVSGVESFMGKASQMITIPPSKAAEGPVARAWYKTVNSSSATADFLTMAGVRQPLSASWAQASVCLPPKRSGMAYELTFQYDGNKGTTSALVDDVSVETSPSCPAQ